MSLLLLTEVFLTCHIQISMSTGHRPQFIPRHTPVLARVTLLLSMDEAQEEQAPCRQWYPMRPDLTRQRHAVLEPLDGRLREAVRLAVERGGVAPRHDGGRGMFCDTRRTVAILDS